VPADKSLSTSDVILAFFPTRSSTFVFTVFRLTCLITNGLVKNKSAQDTRKNTASWPFFPTSISDSAIAASAPPANQMVVRAMVAASITIRTTKTAIQIFHAILISPFHMRYGNVLLYHYMIFSDINQHLEGNFILKFF
jgi:hypothetical protein